MKKGQIALFMVIGMVIAIVAFALFYLAEVLTIDYEVKNSDDFAQSCFEKATVCYLGRLGENGGSLYFEDLKPKSVFHHQGYFNSAIGNCQGNFTELRKKGISVEFDNPKIEINYNLRDTTVNVDQKITYRTASKTTSQNEYRVKIPIRLKENQETATKLKAFPESELIKEGAINADLLDRLDIQTNVYIAENDKQVYSLTDRKSVIAGQDYKFLFVR